MTIYTFHRAEGFYPLEMRQGDIEARANAECNPGTQRVCDITGRVVWSDGKGRTAEDRMAVMTDHDAARLAADTLALARWWANSSDRPTEIGLAEIAGRLLRLLDAAARPHDADDDPPIIPGHEPRTIKVQMTTHETPPPLPIEDDRPHDAEFVTRAKYDEALAYNTTGHDAWMADKARAEAAERRIAELEDELDLAETNGRRLNDLGIVVSDQLKAVTADRDRLRSDRRAAADAHDRLDARVAELEAERDDARDQTVDIQQQMFKERGVAANLAAALAASEAKLCEAQVVINAALDDLEAGDEAGAHLILKHAALRPAEEK